MSSTAEKLSVTEKVGYSLGDLAANLIFQTFITFLAFFYTDVYRIPAAHGGDDHLRRRHCSARSCSRPSSASSPTARTRAGASSGRGYCGRRSRSACCRCWPSARRTSGRRARSIYALVTYTLLVLVYAANNLPYSALSGVLTGNMAQRNSLSSLPLRRGDGRAVRHPGAAAAAGADPRRRRQGAGLPEHDAAVRRGRHACSS